MNCGSCNTRYTVPLGTNVFNSLAPGRFEQSFRSVIFKLISVTDGWGISSKIALKWMPQDLTDDKSTLVQVMAWCRQATSHYLSQCWPRFMSLYGATGHKCVKRCYNVMEPIPISKPLKLCLFWRCGLLLHVLLESIWKVNQQQALC